MINDILGIKITTIQKFLILTNCMYILFRFNDKFIKIYY